MTEDAETSTTNPADQQPYEDNAAQAVSLLLDMQSMPSHDFVSGGAQFLSPRPTDNMQNTIPNPTTNGRVDGHPVYNTWNPQGLPIDGPTLTFPINWLPINLDTNLDYVSILGQSLSLVSPELEQQAPAFQQMHPPVTGMETTTLTANMDLNNTMPLVMHNGSDALASAYVTSPEQTPSPSSLRSALPSTPSRKAQGYLYATGINGGRVPCTVRDKMDSVPIPGTKPLLPINAEGVSFGAAVPTAQLSRLPSLNHISVVNLLPDNATTRIWPSTYEQIQQGIRQVYVTSGDTEPLDDSAIPSLGHLNFFVHLYFQRCNPVLPILHEHTAPLNDSWLLAMAVAAVGAQFTFTEEFTGLASVLHEILHRALRIEQEADNNVGGNMALIQALFLSQVGLLYHGPPRLFRRAKANHSVLVDLLRCGVLLDSPTGPRPTRASLASADAGAIEREWRKWLQDETRLRLGYAIWMGHRALLSLSDAQARLPHDGLWAAPTAEKWRSIMVQTQDNPNLPSATQQLFVDKRIKLDLGEFSRILLLHGVYQEIWQVKRYFDRPLSNWMISGPDGPADDPADDRPDNDSSDRPSRHPTVRQGGVLDGSTYSSWRNAACDCVDVLHWAANGMIAHLSGSEHPTVFHLHFARVVLLTPFDEIHTLARYLASLDGHQSDVLGPRPTRSQGVTAERAIIAWAQQDEHKARLAVLHCGCFFWHVRRYSALAFYEPVAVFMATLSIWAYSSYASQATNTDRRRDASGSGQENGNGNESESNGGTTSSTSPLGKETRAEDLLPDEMDESFPSFVHLDRPNDDEMVQLFVRSGRPSVMRAYISGIGDICAPNAPMRILKEGVKILTNVSMSWGRTDRYISVLTAMSAALLKLSEEW
ncbi:hypothetical protein SEUCBS140593_006371 [Sporothrix eucalyptigena]|uniref:Transcription factor domain-containing protein n=1 Tax=Sporothrix eucalyptigena TaxID=1812306 RepID=A0ABP0C598_9PEZI